MLLRRARQRAPSRKELAQRVERFQHRGWLALIREARAAGSARRRAVRKLSALRGRAAGAAGATRGGLRPPR
eukprot:5204509-Alexandrium_andersonii.AAC.2